MPLENDGSSLDVVWDGLGLENLHSGIGVYGQNLYEHLTKLGVMPRVTMFSESPVSYVPPSLQLPVLKNALRKLKPVFPVSGYHLASRHRTSSSGLIYHGLSNINLPTIGFVNTKDRFIVTIHDLIPLIVAPQSWLGLQMRALLPLVVGRADKIITGSHWTANLLVEKYGSSAQSKIVVIEYGVNSSDLRTPQIRQARHCQGLTIARGESYKRLEWVAAMAKEMSDWHFVVVTDAVGQKRLASPPSNLSVLTHVTTQKLYELIDQATVMIHPSLYEGWCLPAADALQRGLKLVYCKGSGIDDVAAKAPDLSVGLDKKEPLGAWVQALHEIAVLQRPQEEARRYFLGWDEVSKKVLQTYQTLL